MVPPTGEDAGQGAAFEAHGAVLHQAAEAVAKADDLHVVLIQRGLADAADGGVETGAVAAGGEDADVFAHVLFPLYIGAWLF